MGDRFGGIVRLAARRPLAVLGVVGLLALVGAGLALRLEPSADPDTLVNRSSATFEETERFKDTFGDEAVVVLVKGNLQRTVLTSDLGRLLRLEGCLSGNVPKRNLPQLPRTCTEIADFKPAKVVYGPGTFINTAAGQISDEFVKRQNATAQQAEAAARAASREARKRGASSASQRRVADAAREEVSREFQRQIIQLALRYGLTGLPTIDNADFVSSLVFDTSTGQVGQPKGKFAFLFPSNDAALIQVRLRPDLSNSERRRAIKLIREASNDQAFTPRNGARYVVTGVPVVTEGLATAVQHSIFVLLGAALLVMAATLALVFRTRLRLLPLALALAAAAMTFGALSLAGGSLTMASIAVLPVLIGLAVDYAIQFQARFDEARGRRPRPDPEEAAEAAAGAGGPTIATAGLATAVGFLILLLSPVPMVRGFGLLLVLGIALALGCALTAGFAALVRFAEPRRRPADLPPSFPRLRGRLEGLGPAAALEPSGGMARRPLLACAPRRHRTAAEGAGRGACDSGCGLGRGHAEHGRVGRARAGAGRPPGAEGRERAPGRHRGVRRDRRDGPRRRHHQAGRGGLDDALPARGAPGARLQDRRAL